MSNSVIFGIVVFFLIVLAGFVFRIARAYMRIPRNISFIIGIVVVVLVIHVCRIALFCLKRSRSTSSLIRSGGSADVRVTECHHASPPKYEDALHMRPPGVDKISGSRLPDVSLSELPPPSYDAALSGLFPITLPGGSPTAPRAGAPIDHGDIQGLGDVDSEGQSCQGRHNRAYEPEEEN